MERGGNHLAAGALAAAALPLAVFAFGLPLLLAAPAAALLYAGAALALAPRGHAERIDASKIGRAQAAVAAELIGEAEGAVARLRAAARQLRRPEHRRSVEDLAAAAQAILDRVATAPETLSAVRRLLSYYLPRSAEIAEGLVALQRLSRPDPRRLAGVEATLDRIGEAIAAYAARLDGADFATLDVEIKLIDRALAQDAAASPAGERPAATAPR